MLKQDGNLTSCTEEELTCWKTHFERVLNKECPIAEVVDTLNIDTEVPASEELNQLSIYLVSLPFINVFHF